MRSLARLAALTLALGLGPTGVAWAQECRGQVYLTLDTGNMAQADEIARTLAAEGVQATFFVANERTARGDRALDPSWQAYWAARVAEGHAFGNHTWSHHYVRRDVEGERVEAATVEGRALRLDRAGFCEELRRVDAAFAALTGRRLDGMWRAPAGRVTQQTVRWAASCGFPLHVGWTAAGALGDDLPSEREPNTRLLERALRAVGPGDVLMMHLGVWDRKEPFAPVLRPLIQGLKQRGLCFAPLRAVAR